MPREYFGCWNRTFGDLRNTETASQQTSRFSKESDAYNCSGRPSKRRQKGKRWLPSTGRHQTGQELSGVKVSHAFLAIDQMFLKEVRATSRSTATPAPVNR